jgi:hypothetical protein
MQAVQVGAAKVLSMLFTTADYMQPYLSGNVCFGLDDKQVWHPKLTIIFLAFDCCYPNFD